jgi:uncharacterized protein (DUF1697 family)
MPDATRPVVALLRGVNVGGVKVPMGDLRTMLEGAGVEGARTFLQSGNVIVTPPPGGTRKLGKIIEDVIEEGLGLDIRVIIRTRSELAKIVAANPFIGSDVNPTMVHAVFLESKPPPDHVARLDPDRSPPDRFEVSGREIFVHYPGGSGRSKLNLAYFEKHLGVAGTARNWNTVTKLLSLLGGQSEE